ncbi:MAG: hypothetical protein ACRD9L_17435 [Bryobacteraceae bacterium]
MAASGLRLVPAKSQFGPRASQGKADGRRQWTRSETLALASSQCSRCLGGGLLKSLRGQKPCGCVLRAIFRVCLRRFAVALAAQASPAQVALGAPCLAHGGNRARRSTSYGFPAQEFQADFLLIARRALTKQQYAAFRLYFLAGADYTLCCRRLQLDRGSFFHLVYRIEEILGRAFAETEPYALWPTEEYFGTRVNRGFVFAKRWEAAEAA